MPKKEKIKKAVKKEKVKKVAAAPSLTEPRQAKKPEPNKEGKTAVEDIFSGKYFYAVGRRKRAIVGVKLYPLKNEAKDSFLVNGRNVENYFGGNLFINSLQPLVKFLKEQFHFAVKSFAKGGGLSGQAEAVALGIARAVAKYKPEIRKTLRDKDYLTRDPRKKERKKPGLKKARKAPQWSKR